MRRIGSCVRCGHCCTGVYLEFGMGHAANPEERKAAQDFLDWASFHSGVSVKRLDDDTAEVGLKGDCKYLRFDSEGKALCLIYDNRPEICKRYPEKQNPNCIGFNFCED